MVNVSESVSVALAAFAEEHDGLGAEVLSYYGGDLDDRPHHVRRAILRSLRIP